MLAVLAIVAVVVFEALLHDIRRSALFADFAAETDSDAVDEGHSPACLTASSSVLYSTWG